MEDLKQGKEEYVVYPFAKHKDKIISFVETYKEEIENHIEIKVDDILLSEKFKYFVKGEQCSDDEILEILNKLKEVVFGLMCNTDARSMFEDNGTINWVDTLIGTYFSKKLYEAIKDESVNEVLKMFYTGYMIGRLSGTESLIDIYSKAITILMFLLIRENII